MARNKYTFKKRQKELAKKKKKEEKMQRKMDKRNTDIQPEEDEGVTESPDQAE